MNSLIKFFLLFLVITTVVSCGITGSTRDKKNVSLEGQIQRAVKSWDLSFNGPQPFYEDARTWVPKSGVRGKYHHLKPILSVKILESISGEKVFLSGPHKDGINYLSQNSFGHYNPRFIRKVVHAFDELAENPVFMKTSQIIYDSHLKKTARIYYISRQYIYNLRDFKWIWKTYLKKMKENRPCKDGFLCSPSHYLQETFRTFAEREEKKGYDWYEAVTAPGFWIRREIDGTSDEFYELLESVLKKFDPGFIK